MSCDNCLNGQIILDSLRIDYCECERDRRFKRAAPYWIYEAKDISNVVRERFGTTPHFLRVTANEPTLAAVLRAVFVTFPLTKYHKLPPIVYEKSMVDDHFIKAADSEHWQARQHYTAPWLVIFSGTMGKQHKMLPEIMAELVESRLRRNRATWVIRTSPMDITSPEYSPELERLYRRFEAMGIGKTKDRSRPSTSTPGVDKRVDVSRYF